MNPNTCCIFMVGFVCPPACRCCSDLFTLDNISVSSYFSRTYTQFSLTPTACDHFSNYNFLKQQARAMQWPMVRIPDEIFRDRSRSGPLFTALLAAYREKNSSSWRAFDLANPKR